MKKSRVNPRIGFIGAARLGGDGARHGAGLPFTVWMFRSVTRAMGLFYRCCAVWISAKPRARYNDLFRVGGAQVIMREFCT